MSQKSPDPKVAPSPSTFQMEMQGSLVLCAFFLGAFLWSYFPTMVTLGQRLFSDPEHSHGLFTPIIAGIVLYARRRYLPFIMGPSVIGLLVVLIGAAVRMVGVIYTIQPFEHISMVIVLAGLIWFLFGINVLWWATPAFLIFALGLPLPNMLATQQAARLQAWNAQASAFLMQVLGIPALPQGHIILTTKGDLDIAYACSGLQMMMAFLSVSATVAMLIKAHWAERIAIFLAGIPIALLCNILRVTITAIAYEHFDGKAVRDFFHDAGGYVFIPVALFMLYGLIWLYDKAFPRRQVMPMEVMR